MNTMLKVAVVSVGSLLLSACASTQYVTQASQPAAQPAAPVQSSKGDTDSRYVAVVEHIAKQRGTRVVWVNPPKKDLR